MVLTVQRPVVIAQVRFLGKVVDLPVVVPDCVRTGCLRMAKVLYGWPRFPKRVVYGWPVVVCVRMACGRLHVAESWLAASGWPRVRRPGWSSR